MIDEDMREAQKRLDRINRSGRYSFRQTIDARGCIHVDCDAETFIKEMIANGGYIAYEELRNRLDNLIDNHPDYTD